MASAAPAPAKSTRAAPPAEPDERMSAAVDSLVGTESTRGKSSSPTIAEIDPKLIDIGSNVRKDVGDVTELKASIEQNGLLQPVKVMGPFSDTGRYSLIFGQRRLTSVLALGWARIPAIVIEPGSMGTDAKGRRVIEQLLENLQREDLDALTIAHALRGALDADPELKQNALAALLGKSEQWVSASLGLLETSAKVQQYVAEGKLTPSHAKAIAGLPKAEQDQMATNAVNSRWSAHTLEDQVSWYQDRVKQQKKEGASQAGVRTEASKHIVAELIKRKATKADPISVNGDRPGWVVDLLRKAGYTNVTEQRSSYYTTRPGAAFCDCRAWRVTVQWSGSLTLGQDCVVDAHRKAADKARDTKDSEKRQDESAARETIRIALKAELAHMKIGPLAGRLLLSQLLGWSIDNWSEGKAKATRKRDRNWLALKGLSHAQLLEEIANRVRVHAHSELNLVAIAADVPELMSGQIGLDDAIDAAKAGATA